MLALVGLFCPLEYVFFNCVFLTDLEVLVFLRFLQIELI